MKKQIKFDIFYFDKISFNMFSFSCCIYVCVYVNLDKSCCSLLSQKLYIAGSNNIIQYEYANIMIYIIIMWIKNISIKLVFTSIL